MGKAYVDPAELRRFAADLNRFGTDLQMLVGTLKNRLSGLGESWRDQEQKKFTESFDQTVKGMGKFLEDAHEHVKFLNKKATLIEDYLKQR
jgi:uncharacterized protein YukE